MEKSISEIMNKNVIVANVDDYISDIEIFITENKLSFLPIVDNDNVCFGVISDSDILKFHKNNGNSKLEHAWEICSHPIIEVGTDISIIDAANLLVDKGVHHLVVSDNGDICGVVSSIDFLRYLIKVPSP